MFDRVPRRYLVPNAVTAATPALGAIVQASRGRHESAAWLSSSPRSWTASTASPSGG